MDERQYGLHHSVSLAGIPRHRHRHARDDRRENVGVSFSLPWE